MARHDGHSVTAGYRTGCPTCWEAYRQRARRNEKLRGLGRGEVATAHPAQEFVALVQRQAQQLGLSLNETLTTSGVGKRVYWACLSGATQFVRPATWDRMLAVAPPDRPPRMVPSGGTTVRIRGLALLGWSLQEVQAALGREFYYRLASPMVTRAKAVDIIGLLPTMATKVGTNTRAIRGARRKGWRDLRTIERDALLDPEWDGVGRWIVAIPAQSDRRSMVREVVPPQRGRPVGVATRLRE